MQDGGVHVLLGCPSILLTTYLYLSLTFIESHRVCALKNEVLLKSSPIQDFRSVHGFQCLC